MRVFAAARVACCISRTTSPTRSRTSYSQRRCRARYDQHQTPSQHRPTSAAPTSTPQQNTCRSALSIMSPSMLATTGQPLATHHGFAPCLSLVRCVVALEHRQHQVVVHLACSVASAVQLCIVVALRSELVEEEQGSLVPYPLGEPLGCASVYLRVAARCLLLFMRWLLIVAHPHAYRVALANRHRAS